MIVRTRMAPSPTGEYHVGSLRTMLYNFAFAKQQKGQFILRIEDTDRTRFVEGATERLIAVIKDYGLYWDEGPEVEGPYAPYTQSDRLPLYQDHAQKLIDSGHAYYCFCSPERLTQVRENQQAQGAPLTRYDKYCLSISKEDAQKRVDGGESYVVRFKMPENEEVSYDDLFLGHISFNTKDLDDYILLKSDGFPTYQLAVVVDDHIMKVSHIMRGIEWLPSTPKHHLLYKAFGWEIPLHGHLPNLKELGSNKKLGKRFGSVDGLSFLRDGYLPEATMNFLMLLGWNPGTDKEIYSLEEFIRDFSLEKVHKTDLIVFDREKLLWFNGIYIRNLSVESLYDRIEAWAKKFDIELISQNESKEKVLASLGLVKDRLKKLNEYNELVEYFYKTPEKNDELILRYAKTQDNVEKIIKTFKDLYATISEDKWTVENIDKISHEKQKDLNLTPKEVFMTLRVAITGKDATPPIFDVMQVLGKDLVLDRLVRYI